MDTTTLATSFISLNREYAKGFNAGNLDSSPAKKCAIVACMDCRVNVERMLGLDLGDAHIIRSAGADARAALTSLTVSQHIMGVEQIHIVKHTRCGMQNDANDILRKIVDSVKQKKTSASEAEIAKSLQDMSFRTWDNLEAAVESDVEAVRSNIATVASVTGWIYDVNKGEIRRITETLPPIEMDKSAEPDAFGGQHGPQKVFLTA